MTAAEAERYYYNLRPSVCKRHTICFTMSVSGYEMTTILQVYISGPGPKTLYNLSRSKNAFFFAKDCRFSSKITRELIFLNWLGNGDTILCINCSYGISCFMHLQLNNINTPKMYGSTMQKDDSRTKLHCNKCSQSSKGYLAQYFWFPNYSIVFNTSHTVLHGSTSRLKL